MEMAMGRAVFQSGKAAAREGHTHKVTLDMYGKLVVDNSHDVKIKVDRIAKTISVGCTTITIDAFMKVLDEVIKSNG